MPYNRDSYEKRQIRFLKPIFAHTAPALAIIFFLLFITDAVCRSSIGHLGNSSDCVTYMPDFLTYGLFGWAAAGIFMSVWRCYRDYWCGDIYADLDF